MGTWGFILSLLAVIAAAILLDVFLLWTWRYLRSRRGVREKATNERQPLAPRWFADRLDAFGSSATNLALAWGRLNSLVREAMPREDAARLRWSIVVAALFLNWSIGYAYASAIAIHGWQLWTWLVTVVIAVLALMPPGRPAVSWHRGCWPVLGLVALGGILRLSALATIPPGLHTDESGLAEVTLRHIFLGPRETLSPFRSGLSSQPSMYYYLLWFSMRLFGQNIAALRLPSALAGTLAIAATYFLAAQISGKKVGLFSAALLVAYHYHIHWSRLALNNVWDTLWIPAILGLFAWSWASNRSGGAVLCGVALGLSQYFYAGSKLAILLLPILAATLWRRDRDARKLLIYGAKVVAAAGVVALPLAAFALREPTGLLDRVFVVFFWQRGAGYGLDPAALSWLETVKDQLFRTVAGLTSLTEESGFYRPELPLVMGVAAPLFLAGIIWGILRREWLPVIWIGLAMILGGFMLMSTPASSHYTAAIPAIVWLVALLLDGIRTNVRPWLAWVLLATIMAADLYYYFGVYIPVGPQGDLTLPFPTGPFK